MSGTGYSQTGELLKRAGRFLSRLYRLCSARRPPADSLRAYDAVGRVTNQTDRLSNATRTSYASQSITVVRPNGVPSVTQRYLDGRTKRILENGTVKQSYAYGVNTDGTRWTLTAQGALPGTIISQLLIPNSSLLIGLDFPWQLEVTDLLDRTVASHKPGFGGTILVTSNAYDIANNLLSTSQYAASPLLSTPYSLLSQTLYAYHADGSPLFTALDINTNGVIDLNGPDRVTGTSSTYEKDSSNLWWLVTRQWVYPDLNSTSAVTITTRRVLLTGLGTSVSQQPLTSDLLPFTSNGSSLLTSMSESIDTRGNVTTSATFVDHTARTVNQITLSPMSIQSVIQTTVNGLLVSTVSSTAVTNTYVYDGLFRRIAVTDGRGNTTTTAYNPLGQIAYTEDAASNRTTFGYDSLGRRTEAIDALGNVTYTSYDADNRIAATWGATYPVRYSYDARGRMNEIRTYRSETGGAGIPPANGGDTTRWLYDAPTGLLTHKLYADGLGPAYTYTPDGKLLSRLWARGIVTSYSYIPFSGELVSVDYSDDTPDIAYTFNRLGQPLSAISSVSTNLFTYSPDTLELVSETQNGGVLVRPTDTQGRPSGLSLDEDYTVTYGYDSFGRFSSVSSSVCSVSSVVNYSRLSGTDLISGYTAGPLAVTKAYEPHRDLITSVSNLWGASVISAYDYTNDDLGRRVARQDSGLTFAHSQANAFDYNLRSEVTSALLHTNTYGYVFDPIGNRLVSSHNAETNAYTANNLNQYSNIVVQSVQSAPFVDNRVPLYDFDGNMTFNGGEWHYTWNGENRMILASNAAHTVTYAYDHQGRMVWKEIFDVSNNCKLKIINYIWDNWNIIAETTVSSSPIPHSSFIITNCTQYAWGLDLSTTLQGAGGVGGLLSVIKDDAIFFPACDANGNVTEYINESGTNIAHRVYSVFGETVFLSGISSNEFTFWWNSKPWCGIARLSEYEYRKFSPLLGRWLTRDPIVEKKPETLYYNGGIATARRYLSARRSLSREENNLYLAMENNLIGAFDLLGLKTCIDWDSFKKCSASCDEEYHECLDVFDMIFEECIKAVDVAYATCLEGCFIGRTRTVIMLLERNCAIWQGIAKGVCWNFRQGNHIGCLAWLTGCNARCLEESKFIIPDGCSCKGD